VKDEYELKKLYQKFKELTPSVIFYEPDVDEMTSLCLYGTPEIRKKLRSLSLLLKNNSQYENESK
jgi:hypothetical protein